MGGATRKAMRTWIQANAKALTALIAVALMHLARKRGWLLDDNVTLLMASMLVSLLVYQVPNKSG